VQDHRFILDFQLKSTAVPRTSGSDILFDLDVRTYNLLASPERAGLGVLALVVVHQEPTRWVKVCDESTALAHCAYYLPLTGRRLTENQATVRLSIPRSNRLTPDAMRHLMDRARARWSS
jgi:hypothetical protein